MGRSMMVPRTERGNEDRGVRPTASKLEAVPIPHIESAERRDSVKKMVVDGPALKEE